ncbi:hypothetical protein XF35_39360 [Streptomyces platensis subsp. clarensis]|nr:hypothetical protein [Streptomyces platensis subsp. clarensis]
MAAFRLDGLPPLDASVVELVPDGVVAGRLLAAAGPDLHLLDRDGRHLALDTRLLSGWGIESAPAGLPVSVPLGFGDGQEQLF